jgi:hypothetical protein
MKDRFVLAGALALAIAVFSSAWLLSTRSAAAPVETDTPIAVEVAPTPEPSVPRTPGARNPIALVVTLDRLGGAGAFALSGDRVDVLAFIPSELNEGSAMTRVLLADVAVLRGSATEGLNDKSMTVSVSPDQALLVRSAQTLGVHMFAALRPTDVSIAPAMPDAVSVRDVRAQLAARP